MFESGKWRVLIIPGLHNSGPAHWQSHWELMFPCFVRVQQSEWETPVCDDWVEQIDAAVRNGPEEQTLLVSHSLGCAAVAHWSSRYSRQIHGALLVSPSDVEAAAFPKGPKGFTPMPRSKLNFPGIVIASLNDPFVSTDRARSFASSWGAQLRQFDKIGHINAESNLGTWNDGLDVLRELVRG